VPQDAAGPDVQALLLEEDQRAVVVDAEPGAEADMLGPADTDPPDDLRREAGGGELGRQEPTVQHGAHEAVEVRGGHVRATVG